MVWTQNSNPLNYLWLSSVVAMLPLAFFTWALIVKKFPSWKAGLYTLFIVIALALAVNGMPASKVVMASASGAIYGLFPIMWIVLPSVFLYKLTVASGQFNTIRHSISLLTEDPRLQALLVAFAFGSFLEGAAGFGTPVAIGASILVGLGFRPLQAAIACLIANVASVAYGGLGVPVIALEGTTGISATTIAGTIAWLLPVVSLVVPYYMVVLLSGFKKANEILPAILVVTLSYTATQTLTAMYMGPQLPDILAAFAAAICLTIFIRLNRKSSRYASLYGVESAASVEDLADRPSAPQIIKAWSPYLLMTFFVLIWGIPTIKEALIGAYSGTNPLLNALNTVGAFFSFKIHVPFLHEQIMSQGKLLPIWWKLELLGAGGTAILLTALLTKWIFGMSWMMWLKTGRQTLYELRYTILAIVTISAFSYLANYSGMIHSIGSLLAQSREFFPAVSPLIGWVGVFITGSDTSANVLFGQLQAITATGVGMDPSLALAANTVGGGTAKMLSPQSIALAVAAVGLSGKESELLKKAFKHSLFLLALVSVLTWVYSW
ncbi:L-lactate permease [Paenibacillus wynnii]|uniref:L-lactate permease n=1 Tax=Paenibacillus wynnii TaxID=268407 RepID=A0A098M890_9BACL|nr:L-lactate permease [Paenibacillus wynnii]KGE18755.1 lactate permease [Paenibacillus wynnii]